MSSKKSMCRGSKIMRRTLFYLSVALSAFGIGSFVVFNFYWKVSESSSSSEQKTILNFNSNQRSHILDDLRKQAIEDRKNSSLQKAEFSCEDVNLLAVWTLLRKDKDFKNESSERIENDRISSCSELFQIEKLVDLNNDGVKEAIVGGKDGLVNGANNQAIWIVQKIGKTHKILLQDSFEDYEIKKNATNGYQDVFTKHHDSCCSSSQTTYKFSGGKYQESKCLFVDYGTTGEKNVTTCAEESARIQKGSS